MSGWLPTALRKNTTGENANEKCAFAFVVCCRCFLVLVDSCHLDEEKMKPTVAQVAAEHLRATDNHGVISGDSHLLHEIAEKLGWEHDAWRTEKRVLNAIERTNKGELIKAFTCVHRRRRSFWLPGKL